MKYVMKLMLLLGLLVVSGFVNDAVGQATPMFQTTLYFEDAIGNRDSVIIGHDTLATSNIDEQFGEFEIIEPFDSVFEARIVSYFGDWDETGKIMIDRAELIYPLSWGQGCYYGPRAFLFVYAIHQPITIYWDTIQFRTNHCMNGSMLTNHYTDAVVVPYEPWLYPNEMSYCLSEAGSLTLDLSIEAMEESLEGILAPVRSEKEVEGLGIQTIYGLRFYAAPSFTHFTPCFFTSTDETGSEFSSVNVFPNPTKGDFYFELKGEDNIRQIRIFDSTGNFLFTVKGNEQTVNLGNYPQGIYFALFESDDGKIYTQKVVKM